MSVKALRSRRKCRLLLSGRQAHGKHTFSRDAVVLVQEKHEQVAALESMLSKRRSKVCAQSGARRYALRAALAGMRLQSAV